MQTWKSRISNPRRQQAMAIRAQVEDGIREFFKSRGFLEVRTPTLVASPGMEPHIRPWRASGVGSSRSAGYLQTSPEFAMKKLLAGGLERIFQMCPVFRDEPRSPHHRPEFTMLEWYRASAPNGAKANPAYEQIMSDTEELVAALAQRVHGRPEIPHPNSPSGAIHVAPPWPRLRVRDLFFEHAGVDLARAPIDGDAAKAFWEIDYYKILLDRVEPRLPKNRAVFVTDYPAAHAALAVVAPDADGTHWARRFEPYAGGLELGNAFEELTDPREQRARFERDMRLREQVYGAEFPPSPVDEDFMRALDEGLPPSAGIAVGVDRLAMLLAGCDDIDLVNWLE